MNWNIFCWTPNLTQNLGTFDPNRNGFSNNSGSVWYWRWSISLSLKVDTNLYTNQVGQILNQNVLLLSLSTHSLPFSAFCYFRHTDWNFVTPAKPSLKTIVGSMDSTLTFNLEVAAQLLILRETLFLKEMHFIATNIICIFSIPIRFFIA